MRILRIIPTMNPQHGGVAEAVKQSAILMKSEGIEIDVVCFDEPKSSWLKDIDFTVHALGLGKSAYAFHVTYLTWLRKNVTNYEMVIIDGLWMFHVIGGYVCKISGVPYVVYTHGMLDPYFNIDRLKYLKKLPFWFLVDRNVLAMAKSVVFTCEEELKLAQKSFPLFSATSSVATLGIETNTQSKRVLKEKFFETFPYLVGKKIALFLSRIHEKKGLELLIEAVEICKQELPNNIIFVIAGSGNENYIKKLKYRVDQLGLEKYFEWVGMLSGDVKWGAFTSSEFFILPSHQENFGIVVAEALSQGLPVLITNKVNIWREIKDSHAGLVENDNVEGIAKLIVDYCSATDNDVLRMKENTLQCFNDHFSTEAFKSDFLKLLNN